MRKKIIFLIPCFLWTTGTPEQTSTGLLGRSFWSVSENGEVSTLIIKDMSRLGRDYLKVGFYTEVLFVEKGVRFIAINNGIDSVNQQDSDFTPFLNIINEWYAKDTSKKIRAVMKSKGEAGEHLCTNPPYGYRKDPEDKKHWILDEEAAAVVRRILPCALTATGHHRLPVF